MTTEQATLAASSVLEQYGRFLDASAPRFLPQATAGHGGARQRRYALNPLLGRGWTDMHEFDNGIVLGRMDCCFARPLEETYENLPDNLRLAVVLDGGARAMSVGGDVLVDGVGDVIVRHANPGTLRHRVPGGCVQMAVSLDIPCEMLATLRGQGVNVSFAGARNTCAVLRLRGHVAGDVQQLGRRILRLQPCGSLLEHLELESLGLELLHRLLAACAGRCPEEAPGASGRWQRAVNVALDILHAEWSEPHTIGALARRAGINECYLKSFFRQRTGQGIAAYLRRLRMQHAHEMIRCGHYPLSQVALLCGYERADKFAQAFRREFGLLPSAFRRRGG